MNKNRHQIKIPADVAAIYCEKSKTLNLIGTLKKKSLKLKLKIFLNASKKIIKVSSKPFFRISNAARKK